MPYRSASFEFSTFRARGGRPQQFQSVGVVNYPGPETRYTRIAEFKHITGQCHPDTTIAHEFPSATGDPFWPVPTRENAALYRKYEEMATRGGADVHFVGRLGTYRYYDMHQVVAQALTLSAKLLQGVRHADAVVHAH